MKQKLFMGLIALGLLATGCSDDSKDDPGVVTGLNGYMTLQLNNAPMTKTSEHETSGREAGTGNESKINDVTVVLTDAAGIVSQAVNTTIASGTTTQKFVVNTGTFKVFALVNNPITIANGDDITTKLAEAANASDITAGFKSGSFFMTNSQSDKTKSVMDAGTNVTIAVGDDKLVSISVDRLAAKIRDKTVYTANQPDLADLPTDVKAIMDGVTVQGFVPMNLNKKMNLIQTWATTNAGGDPATLAETVLSTPVGDYLLGAETYKEVSATTGPKDILDTNALVDSVYLTENRPTIKINSNGVVTALERQQTTAVIYRVRAMKGGTPLETFYSYNDKVYADRAALNQVFATAGEDISGITEATDLRKKGILVYEDGIMYYTYFIKDPNTNYQLGGKNYYGVLRNSIYNLQITKIANLGDDVPEDNQEPTDPVDPEEAKIKVELTIKDWVLNNIELEF